MKIIIKVGTQSILSANGTPCEPVMKHLVEQIVSLQTAGHHVVLVSSGAVGYGRTVAEAHHKQFGNSLGEKQVLASLGQHQLMHVYAKMFQTHQMMVSQILLTKQDFQTRHHYLNIARLLRVILEHKNIVPIINENDSVGIEELMFTDNDELAGLIAAQMNADKLVILSHVAGVYTANPNEKDAELISIINPDDAWPEISKVKSDHGRGGMLSKLGTAQKMSALGIATHIASIHETKVIERIIADEPVGTSVLPRKKKSNIKRWLAYNSDKKMGSIVINDGLLAIIKEGKKALSLLPVGIIACYGEFEKSDLVEIKTSQGQIIGLGLAKYDSVKLTSYIGQKDKPEFIHYDHLHLY